MEEKINELLTRGVDEVIIKEHLEQSLHSGEKLRIKFGIDPTGNNLHLGHTVPLRKLKQFQDLGHQIIFLIGDFTAMIGDPTGRSETRKMLSKEAIKENMSSYQDQAAKVLDINKVEVRFNSEWYDKFGVNFLFELTSKFTVAGVLRREDFKKRLESDVDLSILEILYPLMQGYDSVALEADLEIGGVDQKLNLLSGRKVQRAYQQQEQDILTVPLLEGIDGVNKMSKSLDNHIGITENPKDMYSKIMSVADNLIIKYFKLLTDLSEDGIQKIEFDLKSGENPKNIKLKLAEEIVKMYHGKKEAKEAQDNFENIFSKGEFPDDAQVITAIKTDKLIDILVNQKIIESKTEFRRLVEAGAISDYPNKKITDSNELMGKSKRKIKIGKKTFVVLNPL